jgi:hypothetical protein
MTIQTRLLCVIAVSGFAAFAASAPAQALTAQECSAKYQAAKSAGTLNGQKWNDFRKAQCAADATPAAAPAAAPPPAAAASVDAARLKQVGQLYRATGLPTEAADAQAFLFYCFIFGQSLLFLERGPRKRAQLLAQSADKLLAEGQ